MEFYKDFEQPINLEYVENPDEIYIDFEQNNSDLNSFIRDKSRRRKFISILDSVNIPWDCKMTLTDCFNTIENYFFDSDRSNFINLNQLAYTLCRLTGYSQYCDKFKTLKTTVRRDNITKFIESALGGKLVVNEELMLANVMPLIELKTNNYIDPRIPELNHIYYDIDGKNKACLVSKTKGKGKVLLKLQKRKEV